MKIARRLLQIVTGRWMRRLVWFPCILFGCVVLGATLQSRGLRLAILKNTQHRFPAAMNLPVAVSYAPVDNAAVPQTKSPKSNSNNAGLPPTQFGNAVGSYPSPSRVTLGATVPTLQGPMHFTQNQLPTVQQDRFNPSPIPYSSSNGNAHPTVTYHQPNSYASGTAYSAPPSNASAFGTANNNNNYNNYNPNGATDKPAHGLPNQVAESQSNSLGQLADTVRGMHGADSVKLRESLSQMLALAIQQFETKQNKERADLKKAKDALLLWEAAISERESLKRSLVDSHIAQLLNSPDKLNWSFSGAQLINGQPNQLDYQDILSQLWSSQRTQNAISTTEHPQPSFVPTYSSYQDVNQTPPLYLSEPTSTRPILGGSSDSLIGSEQPSGSPNSSSIDAPSETPPTGLPAPDDRPSLPPSY